MIRLSTAAPGTDRDQHELLLANFKNRLELVMSDKDVDVRQLQKMTGISRQAIWNYLNTESTSLPSLFNIFLISRALGVSVDDFLPGNSSKESAFYTIPARVHAGEIDGTNFVIDHIQKNSEKFITYLPASIPENIKTLAVMKCEMAAPAGALETYRDRLASIDAHGLNGIVILDSDKLELLISRRGGVCRSDRQRTCRADGRASKAGRGTVPADSVSRRQFQTKQAEPVDTCRTRLDGKSAF